MAKPVYLHERLTLMHQCVADPVVGHPKVALPTCIARIGGG